MNLKSKNGFTLIEVVVVLIIVGILAAIALPNIFKNIPKGRAAEAMAAFSGYKPDLEVCISKNLAQESVCNDPATYLPSTSHFSFSFITPPINNSKAYVVKATNITTPSSYLTITKSAASVFTIVGFGSYLGIYEG